MDNTILITIISGSFVLMTAVATGFINYKIQKIHKQINSRMDELLALNRKSSKAEGNLEGRAEAKRERGIKTTRRTK